MIRLTTTDLELLVLGFAHQEHEKQPLGFTVEDLKASRNEVPVHHVADVMLGLARRKYLERLPHGSYRITQSGRERIGARRS